MLLGEALVGIKTFCPKQGEDCCLEVCLSLEIVTVLPPPLITKKGIIREGKTVTVCSKFPKNFSAFGADLTKNQWFYTSCWASTAGGGFF